MFQNRNPVRVFIYHCISDGYQRFSENVGCNFNFILHIMSDKAAFVSGALLCVQQGSPNYGPRAECGPPPHLDWPSEQCQRHILSF